MPIQEFGGSRGAGLRMGPEVNTFQNSSEALVLTDRDNYFTANPANLAIYDGNSSLLIRILYNEEDALITRYQARHGGNWVDVSPVVTGLPGSVASLAAVAIGEIPYKLPDGTFGGSNMRVLEDGTILAPPGFGIESGSISFGDVLTVSEASGFLAINNHLNNKQYTIVDHPTPRNAASGVASIFHLTGAEQVFVAQGTDTTTITSNPLLPPQYEVQNTARTNALTFRTGAAMSNVRITITKVSNGVVAKFIPSKTAWVEGFGGLEWGVGDNTFDFGDTPLVFNAGDLIQMEIRADSVNIKGNASQTPYFTATLQVGEFRDMIDTAAYTATDVKNKLVSLTSPNKLPSTAIENAVLSVNGGTGTVTVSTGSIGAQPLDATLTGLAGISTVAGSMIYATGVDTFSVIPSTAFGRDTLVDANAAEGRATLELGDVATRNVDVANGIATLDGSGKLTQMPTKADVGLGNVDNTSDVNKPVSTAQQAAIDLKMAQHNAAVDPHTQYTTTAEAAAAAPVQSVAGKTGTVTLVTSDVTESTNLYYTDTRVGTYLVNNGYNVKSVASSGAGASVFNANTAGAVTLRAINGTGLVTVTQNANDITVSAPTVTGGTYTPTLTNVAGITFSSSASAQYMRVDGVVTVSGRVSINPTGAGGGTSVTLGISLPVASNLANNNECAGSAASPGVAGQCGAITGDAANNRAQLQFVSVSGADEDWFYQFSYRII